MKKEKFIEGFITNINGEIEQIGLDSFVCSEDLILDHGIDSLGFIRLIVFIETTYSMEFEDEYLTLDKYNSIYDLADYVWNSLQ